MTHLKSFSTCLVALMLHSPAWAEIYESTDAQGNLVFSDSPSGPNAQAVDLQQTNVISAPAAEPEESPAPQPFANEQPPVQSTQQVNSPVIIHDRNNNEEDVYNEYSQRQREYERMNPSAPHEVLDAEAPREVGDSDSQMPHEVGDSDMDVPREVGDGDMALPGDMGDSEMAPTREAGDAPAEHRIYHRR